MEDGIEQYMSLLNDINSLKIIIDIICKKYDFHILQKIEHVFEPQGCTIIYMLSESHISIHTFPEKNHMSFDIYTCRQYKDNEVYNNIFHFFIQKLEASIESRCEIINRYF